MNSNKNGILFVGGLFLLICLIIYFTNVLCSTFGIGLNCVTPVIYTPQPGVYGGAVPSVTGLAYKLGSVGTVTSAPNLFFNSTGSVNSTVRIRETALQLKVQSNDSTKADVYVEFSRPFTGLVILEKTDGTTLASQYLNNFSSTVFRGAVI